MYQYKVCGNLSWVGQHYRALGGGGGGVGGDAAVSILQGVVVIESLPPSIMVHVHGLHALLIPGNSIR